MSLKKKLLLTCLSVSLVVSAGAVNPKPETFVEPNFEELAEKFPLHFKGFGKNLKIVEALQAQTARGEFTFSGANELAMEAMKDLSSKLHREKGGENFKHVRVSIDDMIQKNEPIAFMDYMLKIGLIALSEGTGNQDEENFFRAAGFSMPYKLITHMTEKNKMQTVRDFISFLEATDNVKDTPGDFYHSLYAFQEEVGDAVEQKIDQGPFTSIPLFLPGEDILGYFYLAWTYAKGIHPVPVPFENTKDELHGVSMGRWAKMCHDMAHHENDASDITVENFTHALLSKHLGILNERKKTMTAEEKKNFHLKAVVDPYTNFALSVHGLYRQSLVDILSKSLKTYDLAGQQFNDFSISSFVAMHEEPNNIYRAYASCNLEDILKENFTIEKAHMGIVNMGSDTMFKTSYATGESPLSDEEIFNIVKVLDKSKFRDRKNNGIQGGASIDSDDIVDYKIERNKFLIAVTLTTLDGSEYFFNNATNYSSQLNFKHDISILEPMAATLKADYGFEIPSAPNAQDFNGDEEAYEKAANTCFVALEKGRFYTMDIFLKNALQLSQAKSEDFISISEKFTAGYQKAVDELTQKVGPFVGDVHAFLEDLFGQNTQGQLDELEEKVRAAHQEVQEIENKKRELKETMDKLEELRVQDMQSFEAEKARLEDTLRVNFASLEEQRVKNEAEMKRQFELDKKEKESKIKVLEALKGLADVKNAKKDNN